MPSSPPRASKATEAWMPYSVRISNRDWRQDDEGFLRVTARVLQDGVYDYAAAELPDAIREAFPDKPIIRQRIPAEEFTADALTSLEGRPILADSPHDWQLPADAKSREVVVGAVAGAPRRQGDGLVCDMLVTDSRAIEAIKAGQLSEVSAAYNSRLHNSADATADAVQTGLRFNHILLLPAGHGRCGENVRILNQAWDESKHSRADDGKFGEGAGDAKKPEATPGRTPPAGLRHNQRATDDRLTEGFNKARKEIEKRASKPSPKGKTPTGGELNARMRRTRESDHPAKSPVTKNHLKSLSDVIGTLNSNAEQAAKERDYEMQRMYEDDAADLKFIHECLATGHIDAAKEAMRGLDTAVRDEIPEDLYKVVHPELYEKTKNEKDIPMITKTIGTKAFHFTNEDDAVEAESMAGAAQEGAEQASAAKEAEQTSTISTLRKQLEDILAKLAQLESEEAQEALVKEREETGKDEGAIIASTPDEDREGLETALANCKTQKDRVKALTLHVMNKRGVDLAKASDGEIRVAFKTLAASVKNADTATKLPDINTKVVNKADKSKLHHVLR